MVEKYYVRKRHRILFANGMTLNQLALEMWERLGYRQIDASVLSRVLAGERQFSSQQLEVFYTLLKLSRPQQIELEEARLLDVCQRYSINPHLLSRADDGFSELVKDNLHKITQVRHRGLPAMAIEWAQQIGEQIDLKITHSQFTESCKRELLGHRAEIYLQQATAILESKLPDEIEEPMQTITARMKHIGRELNDSQIVGLAQSRWGDTYHIRGNSSLGNSHYHRQATDLLMQAAVVITNLEEKNYSLRVAALSVAAIGDGVVFERIGRELKKTFNLCHPEAKCQSYLKLAEGYLKLGQLTQTRKALDAAWKAYSQIDGYRMKSFRNIQLVRTELELARATNSGFDPTLEKMAKKCIDIAEVLGYHRYQRHLLNLLEGGH